MKILYIDKSIIVCIKPVGVVSTDEPGGLPDLVRKELNSPNELLYTVHRLDRAVSGIIVLARTKAIAAELSRQIEEHEFKKCYLAIVSGTIIDESGTYVDYLLHDKKNNFSEVVSSNRKYAKLARLSFEVIDRSNGTTKVKVELETGRTHQVRVQFSHHGHPLLGDIKYGSRDICDLALWSNQIAFTHPVTSELMTFSQAPPANWPGIIQKVCIHKDKCGSCSYMGVNYRRQLEVKQKQIVELLDSFKHPEPIIGMNSPYYYRNKAQWAFTPGKDKKIAICGIYESGSHRLVPIDECIIENRIADSIITTVRDILPKYKISAYDEKKGTGFLRHVLVRTSDSTGEVMVILVVAEKYFKAQKPFLSELISLHPEISTIVLNINDKFTPVVLGKNQKTIYGKGYITDKLLSKSFRISPGAFYQINSKQTDILYKTALEFADLHTDEFLLDAYCGTGTIGICASDNVKEVIGVELNSAAFKDAIVNAKINKVNNCIFINEDATIFIQNAAKARAHFDVVIMDPPRSGSTPEFINALFRLAPKRIVYVSCSPDTLARDLKQLSNEYVVEKIQPVDMFPHTEHVETVCLLSRMER